MIDVLIIIGTRPEAIKMAPVIRELRGLQGKAQCRVCVTGQHRQMLDQALSLFNITPDHDLNVMEPNQSLSRLTANIMTGLDGVIAEDMPDWVLAQGDTTTVLAASLVAYYHRVPFGHVEAGLRTNNIHSPFPEEANRRIADVTAELFFAPTGRAASALLAEGAREEAVHVTGNTVVDALMEIAAKEYDWAFGPLAFVRGGTKIVLITAHRRESFGGPLRELCEAIRELASTFADEDVQFVYPVHLNPNVRRPVEEILTGLPNVSLVEPLDYLTLVNIMKRSTLIMTDSGGIQEEAPTFGVPVLVMRDTTERPEGVEAGIARLVGTRKDAIIAEASRLLRDRGAHAAMSTVVNPYGDGNAAKRIASILMGRSQR